MAQLNDAVLVIEPGYRTLKIITRVVSMSDGRAVVNKSHNNYEIESKPNEWPVVGRFVQVPHWVFWTRWQFCPNEK